MIDDLVINNFVNHLNINGYPMLFIISRNEKVNDEKTNNQDIDAIAPPLAIEHTKVEVLPQQRTYESRFKPTILSLEKNTANLNTH